MNPWIPIIATYGIQFALDLSKIIADKTDPTPADFQSLIDKHGTLTLQDKLVEYLKTHPELVVKS